MKLYLLRHGKAEDHSPTGRDADRRLTREGIEEARKEAEALASLHLRLDLILTSPLTRARRTAELVAEALEMEDHFRSDDRLACGFRLGELQAILAEHPVQRLMLVGHNPDFPIIAAQLCSGGMIDLKKGGLIRLEVNRPEPGGGILEWVLTPAVLIREE